jgi:hypothetical protein
MINDRVMIQEAARRLGVEDDVIRKHTQGDSSRDGVGTPTPVEEVARGVES